MPSTASDRLVRNLRERFHQLGHGAKGDFVAFSKNRPGGSGMSAQALSYVLNGHRDLTLDHLDDLAAYFDVSVGELFDYQPSDLTGEEQRLIDIWRTLPAETRKHLLGLAAPATLTKQYVPERLVS